MDSVFLFFRSFLETPGFPSSKTRACSKTSVIASTVFFVSVSTVSRTHASEAHLLASHRVSRTQTFNTEVGSSRSSPVWSEAKYLESLFFFSGKKKVSRDRNLYE